MIYNFKGFINSSHSKKYLDDINEDAYVYPDEISDDKAMDIFHKIENFAIENNLKFVIRHFKSNISLRSKKDRYYRVLIKDKKKIKFDNIEYRIYPYTYTKIYNFISSMYKKVNIIGMKKEVIDNHLMNLIDNYGIDRDKVINYIIEHELYKRKFNKKFNHEYNRWEKSDILLDRVGTVLIEERPNIMDKLVPIFGEYHKEKYPWLVAAEDHDLIGLKVNENKLDNNLIVGLGISNGIDVTNQVGIIKDEIDDRYGVEFFNKFNIRQRNLNDKLSSERGLWVNKDKVIFISKKYYDRVKMNPSMILFSLNAKLTIPLYNIMTIDDRIEVDVSQNRDDTIMLNGQELRIGRFFIRTLPFLNQEEIERLVNLYKYKYNDLIKNIMNDKIVEGKDIAHWYLCDNYAEGGGNMINSCMRYEESQRRFKIFTENPDKIKMLILTNTENKLLGRALIWDLDLPSNKKYMDRIYVSDYKYEQFFLDYIEKNSILHYVENEFQSSKNNIDVIYGNPELMEIELDKNYGPDLINPCMDTFKCFYPRSKKLTNYRLKNQEHYLYIDIDF